MKTVEKKFKEWILQHSKLNWKSTGAKFASIILLVLILVYIVEAKSELRRILMHIYEFERSKEE